MTGNDAAQALLLAGAGDTELAAAGLPAGALAGARAAAELLDASRITDALAPAARARLNALEVVAVTESTNADLLARAAPPAGLADVRFAELQTAGRGRRGRRWVAPFGSSLLVSIGWYFPQLRTDLPALSLAAGVATLRALADCGQAGATLKWPNDLEAGGRKLAGILCELKTDAVGGAHVVVGLGLNVALPEAAVAALAAEGRRVADLGALEGGVPARAALAARLVTRGIEMLGQFGEAGITPFLAEWRAADALAARTVRVESGREDYEGVARGVDERGALIVEVGAGTRHVDAGEVSVRAAG